MCENRRFRWGARRVGSPAVPVLLAFIVCTSVAARTITVDNDAPADFNTIQAAIDDANDGDVVIVRPGRYRGNGNRDIDFKGKAITVRSTDPNDPEVVEATIVDCNGLSTAPHCGFIFAAEEDANSVLSGLTIRNGYGSIVEEPGSWSGDAGGGIFCRQASPTIECCRIEGCAAVHGGGMYLRDSQSTISRCVIVNNRLDDSPGLGGGIYCEGGSVIITHCEIAENGLTDLESDTDGGGIYCVGDGVVDIRNCLVRGNYSYAGGTAITCGAVVQLSNCTISDNPGGWGYGISASSDTDIVNCIVWDNGGFDPWEPPGTVHEVSPGANVSYCDVKGGYPGQGNINADPCFADPIRGDYHLKSAAGRWDPNGSAWAQDEPTSPCIDVGDPNSAWCGELWPHGRHINMGAYGGTAHASMSLSDAGRPADLNCDDAVDIRDVDILAKAWLAWKALLVEDIDRNGEVDWRDFAVLGSYWLEGEGQ